MPKYCETERNENEEQGEQKVARSDSSSQAVQKEAHNSTKLLNPTEHGEQSVNKLKEEPHDNFIDFTHKEANRKYSDITIQQESDDPNAPIFKLDNLQVLKKRHRKIKDAT